jgi:RNA polymerase sigma factor (sigma-70 family)
MASSEESQDERAGHRAQFTTTHWSLVLAAGESANPESARALELLCRSYWPPLYAFARRAGHAPEDARDFTQGFFADFLQRKSFAAADPRRGRFRSFLLGSFGHFLTHEHDRATALKRGGGEPALSLDQFESEERAALEPHDPATPEAIFDQRWASLQVERALSRLRESYAATGRGPMFDLLKDYVWGCHNGLSLAEIATRLELTEEAVKKAVQRLRQRFRDALRAEVAQTVTAPDQIDEEMRHLRSALSS